MYQIRLWGTTTVLAFALLALSVAGAHAISSSGDEDGPGRQADQPGTRTFDILPSTTQSADLAERQVDEVFTTFATPTGSSATFSGKVTGLSDYDNSGNNALVGIIYLNGIFWDKYDNYQWASLKPDGTFTITADRYPDAKKILVVKQPGRAWGFLRHDFAAGDSAKDIVINMTDGYRMLVQIEDSNGKPPQGAFQAEVFDGVKFKDATGTFATYQRIGLFHSDGSEPWLVVDVPDEPVALYVSAPGLAPFYQIVDPSKTSVFVFRLLPAAEIHGAVTKGGAPLKDANVSVGCATDPLSWRTAKTADDGIFDIQNMPPGSYTVRVNDVDQPQVVVNPGKTTEVSVAL